MFIDFIGSLQLHRQLQFVLKIFKLCVILKYLFECDGDDDEGNGENEDSENDDSEFQDEEDDSSEDDDESDFSGDDDDDDYGSDEDAEEDSEGLSWDELDKRAFEEDKKAAEKR